jgi:uncharacterized delta-60 repeat protein
MEGKNLPLRVELFIVLENFVMKRFLNFIISLCLLANTNLFAQQPGQLDTSFNPSTGANNFVYATAVQTDGKIIIGGTFTSFNGIARNRIARLNADGSLDPSFNPGTGADALVYTIAIQPDGKIVIGGSFTSFNGSSRNYIARLNADGSLDMSFNPGTGPDGNIWTVALQPDGKTIIGGAFSIYNGTTCGYIARLNIGGSLDGSFNTGTGADEVVSSAVVQPDGKIVIIGDFNGFNGITRRTVARLLSNGNLDTSLNMSAALGGLVSKEALAVQADGKIIFGGLVSSNHGASGNCIIRINPDGSLDTNFNPGTGASGPVWTIKVLPSGKIILGGEFWNFDGVSRKSIARLNVDGSLDLSFNPGTGADRFVFTTAVQPDGKIIIGGSFNNFNGTGRNSIARLNGGSVLSTSLSQNEKLNEGFSVYPNPIRTNQELVLKFAETLRSPGIIYLYDALGKLVLEHRIGQGQFKALFPVSGLQAGLYQVKFISKDYSSSTKIIIE